MTIRVYQDAEETTRSANNGCSWIAETIINGIVYSARSRHGAAHELARVLVMAGIPDAVMRVTTAGLRGEMVYARFMGWRPIRSERTRRRRCGGPGG